MAAVSFSASRNGGAIDVLAAGSQTWTEGTSAPGAGDIEIRFADGVAWTRNEIEIAMDTLFRFLLDANRQTSIPL